MGSNAVERIVRRHLIRIVIALLALIVLPTCSEDAGHLDASDRAACTRADECPGTDPACDEPDLIDCGCGVFRVCERGQCFEGHVACDFFDVGTVSGDR
jgi:hypothetical protein